MCDQPPTPTLADAIPEPSTGPGFLSYLADQVLADPRTKAQIGTTIRSLLVAFGSAWAATHADAINLIAGILLALVTTAWGIYQKFRVDRKIKRLAVAKFPPKEEIKP